MAYNNWENLETWIIADWLQNRAALKRAPLADLPAIVAESVADDDDLAAELLAAALDRVAWAQIAQTMEG